MFRNFWKRPDVSANAEAAVGAVSPIPSVPPAPDTPAPPTEREKLFSFDILGPTAVITVTEHNLTSTSTADLLHELRALLAQQPAVRNLVLDLQNVDYLDSACLNMLIVLLKAVREAGGTIALASAKRSVEVLFKLTRLDSLFPIQRDVLDAIGYVERAAAA